MQMRRMQDQAQSPKPLPSLPRPFSGWGRWSMSTQGSKPSLRPPCGRRLLCTPQPAEPLRIAAAAAAAAAAVAAELAAAAAAELAPPGGGALAAAGGSEAAPRRRRRPWRRPRWPPPGASLRQQGGGHSPPAPPPSARWQSRATSLGPPPPVGSQGRRRRARLRAVSPGATSPPAGRVPQGWGPSPRPSRPAAFPATCGAAPPAVTTAAGPAEQNSLLAYRRRTAHKNLPLTTHSQFIYTSPYACTGYWQLTCTSSCAFATHLQFIYNSFTPHLHLAV